MKITKSQLKQIIKEEIEEALGVPSPEYHDIASKIGRPVSALGTLTGDKPIATQGPALPGEVQEVADFVNKKIPAWLDHTSEMRKHIRKEDSVVSKVSPDIKELLDPIQNFQYHVKLLQKNLEQDKPVRRHAMGQPFSNDYVEVPTENEEAVFVYAFRELEQAYVQAYQIHGDPSLQQPNHRKVAKKVNHIMSYLVGGREKWSWPGAQRREDPETGLHHGPIGYNPEKDVYPSRYPYYKSHFGENLKKIIKEELGTVLNESDIMNTLGELEPTHAQEIIDAARGVFIDDPREWENVGKYEKLSDEDKVLADELVDYNRRKLGES